MLLRLIGLRHVLVLLNKADLLDFDADRLAAAAQAITALLAQMAITPIALIPASARLGDNVAVRSEQMAWYDGPTLVEALAAVPPLPPQVDRPLRLPIQDVYRFDDKRLVVGRIESGRIQVGDAILVGAAAIPARVAAIEAWHAPPQTTAVAGQSVALLLEPDIVAERGDLIHTPDQPPLRAARLRARLFWLRQEPLRVGEAFRLRIATADHAVTVAAIESVVQIEDLTEQQADHVPPESFAEIVLAASANLLFDAFEPARLGGRGVLVDSQQCIVGVTPLLGPAPLPEAARVLFPVDSAVSPQERALAKGHASGVFWLTGLPGAGKSTLARAVEAMLFRSGIDTVVLDGDTLRARLSPDLGFSAEDRAENVRRTAAVARLMADAGLVVLVALISPRESDRILARQVIGTAFHEIHVAADLATCEARDPKGLYAAARAGKIQGFTGIDAPYDVPRSAALVIDTAASPVAVSTERLAAYIRSATARSADTPG